MIGIDQSTGLDSDADIFFVKSQDGFEYIGFVMFKRFVYTAENFSEYRFTLPCWLVEGLPEHVRYITVYLDGEDYMTRREDWVRNASDTYLWVPPC